MPSTSSLQRRCPPLSPVAYKVRVCKELNLLSSSKICYLTRVHWHTKVVIFGKLLLLFAAARPKCCMQNVAGS